MLVPMRKSSLVRHWLFGVLEFELELRFPLLFTLKGLLVSSEDEVDGTAEVAEVAELAELAELADELGTDEWAKSVSYLTCAFNGGSIELRSGGSAALSPAILPEY